MNWALNKEEARNCIGDTNTPATILHVILLKQYGAGYLYGDADNPPVDPVVLWNDLEEDFRITVPLETENKINAIMTACSTDVFFTDVAAFMAICVSLTTGDLGDAVNGAFEEPTLVEMLQAIREVDINDGDREVTFSPTVLSVIRDILEKENVDTADEVDAYTEEVDVYIAGITRGLMAIGAPEELAVITEDSDYFGLFG